MPPSRTIGHDVPVFLIVKLLEPFTLKVFFTVNGPPFGPNSQSPLAGQAIVCPSPPMLSVNGPGSIALMPVYGPNENVPAPLAAIGAVKESPWMPR